MTKATPIILLSALAAVSSCGNADAPAADSAAPQKSTEQRPQASPGKPSAPVDIRYTVLGTPVVGQPVAIQIELATDVSDRPFKVSYFVNDTDSMLFPESQPQSIELSVPETEGAAARQVTVIPQREGRLYLNVTAEIESGSGSTLKSMSIPLVVGVDSVETETNGELRETADGETVISMPAREN